MNIKLSLLLVAILILSACVAPNRRTDPNAFQSKQAGRIDKNDVPAFTDCVMDGFSQSHFIMTNFNVKQQRRTNGYRVETFAGGGSMIMMSADIFDDGRVELFEADAAALIDTQGERAAFSECLKKYELLK